MRRLEGRQRKNLLLCYSFRRAVFDTTEPKPWKILRILTGVRRASSGGMTDAEIDRITHRIMGCGIRVHRAFGAGLLESVYDECMVIEFGDAGLNFERERRISLRYRNKPLMNHLRIDFLVEGCVIVELKSVECIHPIHQSQLITYLKLANCPAGLILNFNVVSLRNGLKRVNHPDRFRPKLCS